jgi:SAM-dependent methyltransferase/uncharacterized protein YbaR (Trm112 family)
MMPDNGLMFEELCEIIRCPISRARVWPATPQRLAALNELVRQRRLFHHDGTPVEQEIEAGLITEDEKYLYVVKDGIALVMPGNAVNLDLSAAAPQGDVFRSEKQNVQSFYDEVGWTKGADGEFEDALIWEDLRPISARYIHDCHIRVNRHLAETGRYLLDAASGPVQYKEYLTYSERYRRRVCVDISFRALSEARRKLGDGGLYVLGDITNLPFIDGSMDGVVSLHTIYHVPADEQRNAFTELHRVLKPGRSGIVVYNWYNSVLTSVLMVPAPVIQKLKNAAARVFRTKPAPQADGVNDSAAVAKREPPKLYSFAHPRKWFTSQQWAFPLEFTVWRSLSVPCMRTWVRPVLMGRATLAILYWLEDRFPHLFGKLGEYPMLVIRKA